MPVASVGNTGGATGDLLYWNGSNWVRLPAVATGQLLISQGVGAAPAYATQTSLGLATYAAKVHVARDQSAGTNTISSGAINIASVTSNKNPSDIIEWTINFTDTVSTTLPMRFSGENETRYKVTSRSSAAVVLTSTGAVSVANSDCSISLVVFN